MVCGRQEAEAQAATDAARQQSLSAAERAKLQIARQRELMLSKKKELDAPTASAAPAKPEPTEKEKKLAQVRFCLSILFACIWCL